MSNAKVMQYNLIHDLCANHDLPGLLQLLEKQKLFRGNITQNKSVILNICLQASLANGHIDMVAYLLNEPTLIMHPPLIPELLSECVHLAMAKYMLPLLEDKHTAIAKAFPLTHNRCEIMHYLLDQPEFATHPQKQSVINNCLYNACLHANLDAVKYLLTAPALLQPNKYNVVIGHADIYSMNALAVLYAMNSSPEIVKYLIVDYGLERLPLIETAIHGDCKYGMLAQELFAKVEFKEKLQHELPSMPQHIKYKI